MISRPSSDAKEFGFLIENFLKGRKGSFTVDMKLAFVSLPQFSPFNGLINDEGMAVQIYFTKPGHVKWNLIGIGNHVQADILLDEFDGPVDSFIPTEVKIEFIEGGPNDGEKAIYFYFGQEERFRGRILE